MSQVPVQDNNQPTVRPKMRHPHPAAAAAAQFRQETAHLRAGEPAPAPSTPAAPVVDPAPVQYTPPVQPVPVPPQPAAPVTPTQPVQYAPVQNVPVPPQYADILGAGTPTPSTTPVTPEKSAGPTPEEIEAKFRKENEELLRQLEQTRNELAEAKKIPDDLLQLKEERELDELLATYSSEFQSIDPADAKKLLAPVLKTVRQQSSKATEALQNQLLSQQKELHNRFKQLEERERLDRLNKTRDKILKAHPDLAQLQQTPAYQQAMMTPVGGKSGILVGQLVAAEYQQGNADYIIDVLNAVKQQAQPDLAGVASVSPSAAATIPAAPTDGTPGRLTAEQIAEYKFMVQTGQMSREDFREVMKKHREAQR